MVRILMSFIAQKNIRIYIFLVQYIFIFICGFIIGLILYGTKKNLYNIYEESPVWNIKPLKQIKPIEKEALKTFSFAYNLTHLWSMHLADENYYRIARLLPCRTVNYSGGPKLEPMNFCDQATINQYSIEKTLHAQQWIYEHQHPVDCTNKKFAIIHQYAGSGFGSTVHQILWAFGVVLGQDRIAVYETPGNWLYGNCPSGNPDCLFLPISNCSVPSTVDGEQTVRITADFGHWTNPVLPPIFQNSSFNWYRSQLLFYLMRYNSETLAHVENTVARYFNPPSISLHRPYIAIYVRRSDKVRGREMLRAYTLKEYFNLFNQDARQVKINKVYINSEDPNVFDEFPQVNKDNDDYYKLLNTNATKNVIYMSILGMPSEVRKKIVLEFLTDLFVEANANLHVGTLTSNWCRLVDEIRFALGKTIPFYTPESRFIIDV